MPTPETPNAQEALARQIVELKTQNDGLNTELGTLRSQCSQYDNQIRDLRKTLNDLEQARQADHLANIQTRDAEERELDYYRAAPTEIGVRAAGTGRRGGAAVAVKAGKEGREVVRLLSWDEPVAGKPGAYVTHWGLLDDPEPRTAAQRRLQEAVTKRSLVRALLRSSGQDKPSSPRCDAEVERELKALPDHLRLFTDSSTFGAELIPDFVYPTIEADLRLPTGIMAWLKTADLPPSGTLNLPFQTGLIRPYKQTIPAANDPAGIQLSEWLSNSNAISAVEMAVAVQIARNALEDAILSVYPMIVSELTQALQYGLSDIQVNADSNATHQDAIASWNPRSMWSTTTGAGSAVDHRRSWLGWRAEAYDNSSTYDASTFAIGKIVNTVKKLDAASAGKLGVANGLLIGASVEAALAIIQFDSVLTLDHVLNPAIMRGLGGFGMAQDSGMPGLVGAILGCPIVVEPFITADLAATGLYTDGTGGTTGILAVDRTMYTRWIRKAAMVEIADDIRSNTRDLVARTRQIVAKNCAPTRKTVAWGFNIS